MYDPAGGLVARLDRSPISHEDEFCVAVTWF